MAGELLLDTGPLVSLLDRDQAHHGDCLERFESWTGTVVTTEAVLTEATHLLGRIEGGRRACVDFILEGGAQIVPPTRASLSRVAELIEKYEDVPMDYADATLVVLGEDLGCDRVFTLDRRGFSAYRMHGRKAFRMIP